jgi:CRISPR-associated protein Cmr1
MDPNDLPGYTPLAPPGTQKHWDIPIETVTPLYGGGSRARHVDRATPVRVSAIRGQLRFWWRALFGGGFADTRTLYARERELFGGLGAGPDEVVRSPLTLEVRDLDLSSTEVEDDDVKPWDDDGYVLWPARATRTGDPPAQRWRPGVRFCLFAQLRCVSTASQASAEREIEHALRAWLLFGGIGGRTRRGCGSLAVVGDDARARWLPEGDEISSIASWLAPNSTGETKYPVLSGAVLSLGQQMPAIQAWRTAFGWLKEFRQGSPRDPIDTTQSGNAARQRPSRASGNAGRPGRSRWPEADCARRAFGASDHPVLIGDAPACWPRAQFGLPIQMQFQKKDRSGNFFANRPPPNLELTWSEGGESRQRLASPLIVKPIQRRDGRFVPVALWLKRSLPRNAMVGIDDGDRPLRAAARIEAVPQGPLFVPLAGKASVEQAFTDWLNTTRRATRGGRL